MNRPLGEYQKVMIESVLKKYGQYTIKRPIDKQTVRCLDSLVKRGLVTFDAKTQTYRLKPEQEAR
jgi:DNA-binding IclR family transcriptional regulator